MPRTRSRSRLWAVASLAVLVFAGWQTVTILSREPAFNRSLQVETATNRRIPSYSKTMYDGAEYLSWVARGWYSSTFNSALPAEEGAPERKAALLERASRTRDIASDSLRHNPGDPMVWLLVANADSILGDKQGALVAWQKSYDLAPQNSVVALERLMFLIRFMSEPNGRNLVRAMIAPATVQADLKTLRADLNLRTLADGLSSHPAIISYLDGQMEQD